LVLGDKKVKKERDFAVGREEKVSPRPKKKEWECSEGEKGPAFYCGPN